MEWFLWICVAVVLGLAAVAGSGRLGSLPPAVQDAPVVDVPEGPLTGDDVRGVRFATVARGYSMAQVDDLLERLASQLDGGRSAIMDADVFSQPGREGDHGSNEAPHG